MMSPRLNSNNRRRRRGNLITPKVGRDATTLEAGVGRDTTALEAEPSLIVLGESEDLALGVEHILPVSPILGVEI